MISYLQGYAAVEAVKKMLKMKPEERLPQKPKKAEPSKRKRKPTFDVVLEPSKLHLPDLRHESCSLLRRSAQLKLECTPVQLKLEPKFEI